MMNLRSTAASLTIALAGLLASSTCAFAQHDHGHAEVKPAQTFSEAVGRIRAEADELKRLLDARSVTAAHEPADAIAQLAASLGRLAFAPGSGVPKEKVRDANVSGKDLAKLAAQMHDAADRNDAAACSQLLPRVQQLVAAISVLAPEKWVCDMHCEPGKTFDGPGICPVCKMAFKPISQVPFSANVVAAHSPVQPGQKTDLTVRLVDPAGNIVPLEQLEIVHEQPLHLLIVSADLSWYAHEHPAPQPDGSFRLQGLTFPSPGEYTFFHDFTPKGRPPQVPQVKLRVAGQPPVRTPLVEDYDVVGHVDGYEFRVRCNGEKFFAGTDSFIRIGIDLDSAPVTDLQPYLGAMGHLVIISKDLKQFVHSHPIDLDGPGDHDHGGAHAGHDHDSILAGARKSVALANGKPSDVVFHAVFPAPGLYKAFAQFQHRGKILTFPFVIDALPGDVAAPHQHGDSGPQGQDHGAHGDHK